MIGYNSDEINNLISTLNSSYQKLGETMSTGWDTVSSTLGTEWIGPDELSFETELAKRMCALYYSCKESVQGMIENVRKLGQTWQDFQNANLITGVTASTTVSFDVAAVDLGDYAIETVVKPAERAFSSGTRMGVTNGEQSAANINTKVTEYVNAIGDNVKKMYDTTSSATAFLGSSQSDAIDTYLKNMATSFSSIVTQVQDMQTTLTTLVKNYNTQMESLATQVNGIDTSVSSTSKNNTQATQ